MALSRDVATAEDLVQETCLRALSAASPLRTDGNHKSWLFTILRNIWLNQLRKGRWTPQSLDDDPSGNSVNLPEDPDGDPFQQYVSKVEVARVREAIEKLPPDFREIIILREYEELPYQEIATILRCPAGTVMSRLARARSRLRSILVSEERQDRRVGRTLMSASPAEPSK